MLCVRVSVFVRAQAHGCACVYVRGSVCVSVRACVRAFVCARVRVRACVSTCICMSRARDRTSF